MVALVLNDEQTDILDKADEDVFLCDSHGNVIGCVRSAISPDDAAIITEAKRRLATPQPRYTTAQVLEHLETLETP